MTPAEKRREYGEVIAHILLAALIIPKWDFGQVFFGRLRSMVLAKGGSWQRRLSAILSHHLDIPPGALY